LECIPISMCGRVHGELYWEILLVQAVHALEAGDSWNQALVFGVLRYKVCVEL
jgi:hypothetical protein